MESSKFHQQHQDHQPVLDSSCYGLSWSQNSILYNTNNNDTNSRDPKQHVVSNIDFVNTGNPMLGLTQNTYEDNNDNNNNNVARNPAENFMTHELQRLARMKDHEISSPESYPKFSEMINSSPTSSIEDLHLNPSPGYNNNQELLLTTFSNGCQIKGGQLIDRFPNDTSNNHYQNSSSQTSSRGTFSQIFPTINISNLNQSPVAISSNSFDMNLPALDLFGSPRFNGNFSHPSSFNIPNHHQLGSFFKDTCLSYGLDQMHQPNHTPVICHSKLSSPRTNCTEAKRPATSYMDNTKAPQAAVQKKTKLEPRSSCAPFKVRKEKLGDRIAALQQLVAPFGKTDTASVLMEAIGYIKFLQNQVETLSVPYMKPAHKNSMVPTRGVSVEGGNEDAKRDLRSRGLCLIPLSCLSYVTDGGGGVWPAP
ncbi:putative transcription factor bHLH family [Helianthus annuus]|uniref:Putative myc-type, basic helix-loop-helix (BHLH) domain-containing protein n=1 Tax=Helianthus annuus TaxID=4232 RepID=A0A251UR55_HELAN|nr:transcription factor bHLH110 isoform X1 [Helianthus annuus]KAF5806697.1 putative transcription factor bHLH family [Helianthus annuus]KAJ0585283.1 putative transcription factor bHLH family [Helianthus annuus]KAJ0919786.1 putative transcription factor bHLH family [Helianthus annuus]